MSSVVYFKRSCGPFYGMAHKGKRERERETHAARQRRLLHKLIEFHGRDEEEKKTPPHLVRHSLSMSDY